MILLNFQSETRTEFNPSLCEIQVKVSTKKSKSEIKEDANKVPYVHVRARRGQATDNHSLAERVMSLIKLKLIIKYFLLIKKFNITCTFLKLFFVGILQARREKINARMKLLQELVPGCNKV